MLRSNEIAQVSLIIYGRDSVAETARGRVSLAARSLDGTDAQAVAQ